MQSISKMKWEQPMIIPLLDPYQQLENSFTGVLPKAY